MFEEIKQISNDSIINDQLRQAMIKQMEIGYQEMGKLNLSIANEALYIENESENKVVDYLKGV